MKMQSFAQARALLREFFPTWSRRARARWVLARLHAPQPKVPISAGWSHDMRAYWYQKSLARQQLSSQRPDFREMKSGRCS